MKWAVAYMNFFDNELRVEIVEANTMIEALSKHSKLSSNETGWLKNMPNNLEQIRTMFFDADAAIDIIEIDIKTIQKKGRGIRHNIVREPDDFDITRSSQSRDGEPS